MGKSALYHFRLLRQLQPFLDRKDLVTMVHDLITPRLFYCNVLYMRLPLKSVQKLYLLQNIAAGMLSGLGHRDLFPSTI